MNNLDAEQYLLAGILLDPESELDELAQTVKPADFSEPTHGQVFDAMLALADRRLPIEVPALKEQLQAKGLLTERMATLVEVLYRVLPASANLEHYARIVRDRARVRRLLGVLQEIAKLAKASAGEQVDSLLDEAERRILALREEHQRQGFKTMREVVKATLARVEQLYNAESPVVGMPTGIADLDALTGGLHPGQLVILAARPKMGKTALAFQVAANVAASGRGVGAFSLEMTCDELGPRMFASHARVDGQRLRSGRLIESDWSKLGRAATELVSLPLEIDDTLHTNVQEIRAKARRLAQRFRSTSTPLGLIVVDYLQLAGAFGENREQEIAAISRGLKALAKELAVPVLALSQLNRSLEKRPDKRPMLSDLRDSGALEQDADTVLFVYRDEVYHPETEHAGVVELILAAQRNGPTGTIRCSFLAPYMRFEGMARPAPVQGSMYPGLNS